MKKIRRFAFLLVLSIGIVFLSACGEVVVKYDLASEGASMTYTMVCNMQKTPSKYANKTFRIKGKIDSEAEEMYLYGYIDTIDCCYWSLPLYTNNTDIDLSKKKGSVTILATYKKMGGEYVLDVIGLG